MESSEPVKRWYYLRLLSLEFCQNPVVASKLNYQVAHDIGGGILSRVQQREHVLLQINGMQVVQNKSHITQVTLTHPIEQV
jgi:hypothetical protein